mmetsp:Transcript_62739/g.72015  ORF Transcript_62739/g.72015 Transcript_62739/m.72015 type:complete len:175 (+) Transcript_62739:1-525(+)
MDENFICYTCGSSGHLRTPSKKEYAFEDAAFCSACPSDAYCFGGDAIAPQPNTSRLLETSTSFIECPKGVCAGIDPSRDQQAVIDGQLRQGRCETGYEGTLCRNCDESSGFIPIWPQYCKKTRNVGRDTTNFFHCRHNRTDSSATLEARFNFGDQPTVIHARGHTHNLDSGLRL